MNTASDTPRTDAVIKASWEYLSVPTNAITAEFARQLERELNEAIKELTHLSNLIDAHFENGGTIAGLGTTNKARQIIEKSKP